MLGKSWYFLALLLMASCKVDQSTSATSAAENNNTQNKKMALSTDQSGKQENKTPIAPEYCRIRAKVVAIKGLDKTYPEGSPCNDYPCAAQIMIEKVIGYGSTFSTTLANEQLIDVYFPFTLHSTKEVFTKREVKELPGLKVGDTFEADMEGGGLLKEKDYTIYSYTINR